MNKRNKDQRDLCDEDTLHSQITDLREIHVLSLNPHASNRTWPQPEDKLEAYANLELTQI